ncbi:MAG: hypothetical protein DCC68_24800 [Planctomycetota bacterium]|nr:MAG: hypothetical protein DCC68_24800 [Planctomycetota bacterium]
MRARHVTSHRFTLSGTKQLRKAAPPQSALRAIRLSRRAKRGQRNAKLPYSAPEDWHEPREHAREGYRFVVREPGVGFRHVLTTDEVRDRLAELPERFVAPLEVVQLSQMTRKKLYCPCYGMQWGKALYLYPIEESLVENFHRPPKPQVYQECRLYGGRWFEEAGRWRLEWTERAIKDFFLHNILIHELGHLLDERNSNYADRERYAEWFAIEYGYKRFRQTDRGRQIAAAFSR